MVTSFSSMMLMLMLLFWKVERSFSVIVALFFATIHCVIFKISFVLYDVTWKLYACHE